MKKQITFVLAAFFAAAVISFGCSDEGGGGEIPTDVGGNYTIKSSTCPFASAEGKFSVTQIPTNKEVLSISLKAAQKGAATVGAPDFYESQEQALPDQQTKKTSVISANVSAGGGLTAQIKYGEVTYDCSGSFKKDGETKLTDFNCAAGSTTCSFSAEGTTATTATTIDIAEPSGAEGTIAEGAEGGACINGTTCNNEELECVENICKLVVAINPPPVEGAEGSPCKEGACNEGLVCQDGTCVVKVDKVKPPTIQCANGMKLKGSKCVGAKKWAKFGTNDFFVKSMAVVGNKIFAATDKGVYRYDKVTDIYWDWKNVLPYTNVFKLFVKEKIIYAGTAGQGIYKSEDNGENWQAFNAGLGGGKQLNVASFEAIGDKLYAGTCDGVIEYNSDTQNLMWKKYKLGLDGKCVWSLYNKPTGYKAGLFAGIMNGGVYHLDSGKLVWEALNLGLNVSTSVNKFILVKNTIFIATNEGVFKLETKNGVWQWVSVGLGEDNVLALLEYSDALYSGTASGVFEYLDPAWTQFNGNNENLNSKSVNVLIYLAPSFYAGTNKGVYNYVP